jgi:hypothetical protein
LACVRFYLLFENAANAIVLKVSPMKGGKPLKDELIDEHVLVSRDSVMRNRLAQSNASVYSTASAGSPTARRVIRSLSEWRSNSSSPHFAAAGNAGIAPSGPAV